MDMDNPIEAAPEVLAPRDAKGRLQKGSKLNPTGTKKAKRPGQADPDKLRGSRAVRARQQEFESLVKKPLTPDLKHMLRDAAVTKVNLDHLDRYVLKLQGQKATTATVTEIVKVIRERSKLSVGLMKLFTRLGVGREERRDVSKKEQQRLDAAQRMKEMQESLRRGDRPAEPGNQAG